jgi:hypothetical protein
MHLRSLAYSRCSSSSDPRGPLRCCFVCKCPINHLFTATASPGAAARHPEIIFNFGPTRCTSAVHRRCSTLSAPVRTYGTTVKPFCQNVFHISVGEFHRCPNRPFQEPGQSLSIGTEEADSARHGRIVRAPAWAHSPGNFATRGYCGRSRARGCCRTSGPVRRLLPVWTTASARRDASVGDQVGRNIGRHDKVCIPMFSVRPVCFLYFAATGLKVAGTWVNPRTFGLCARARPLS